MNILHIECTNNFDTDSLDRYMVDIDRCGDGASTQVRLTAVAACLAIWNGTPTLILRDEDGWLFKTTNRAVIDEHDHIINYIDWYGQLPLGIDVKA